jgi:DNA-binding MarR family transcriptional regulator
MPAELHPFTDIVDIITRTIARMQETAMDAGEFADLSMRQITCLDLVAHMAEPTATDLARALQVTKPTVSALLARLVQNGYVRKERSHTDARAWHVHLTERGEAVMAAHRAVHERIAERLVRNLDEIERAQLAALLTKVADSAPNERRLPGDVALPLASA